MPFAEGFAATSFFVGGLLSRASQRADSWALKGLKALILKFSNKLILGCEFGCVISLQQEAMSKKD